MEIEAHEALRLRAQRWVERQMVRLERIHGEAWPRTRDWVHEYLCAEARDLAGKEMT